MDWKHFKIFRPFKIISSNTSKELDLQKEFNITFLDRQFWFFMKYGLVYQHHQALVVPKVYWFQEDQPLLLQLM